MEVAGDAPATGDDSNSGADRCPSDQNLWPSPDKDDDYAAQALAAAGVPPEDPAW